MTSRTTRRGIAAATLAVLLTTGLAGCSALGGDDGRGDDGTAGQGAAGAVSAPAAGDGAATAAADPQPNGSVAGGGGVAGFDGKTEIGAKPYRVDVEGLQVTGSLMRLTFTLRSMSDDSLTGYDVFRGSELGADDVSQIYLEDLAAGLRYPNARLEGGRCACSPGVATKVGPNGSGAFYSTFKAPDPGVQKLDVVFGGGLPTVHDVPITR